MFQHLFRYDLLPLGWPNSHQKFIAPANLCEMIIPALENNLSGLEDVADMQRTFFATIERVKNMRKFLSTKPEGWPFALKGRLFDIEVFRAITGASKHWECLN